MFSILQKRKSMIEAGQDDKLQSIQAYTILKRASFDEELIEEAKKLVHKYSFVGYRLGTKNILPQGALPTRRSVLVTAVQIFFRKLQDR